jgi:hypothetical protein
MLRGRGKLPVRAAGTSVAAQRSTYCGAKHVMQAAPRSPRPQHKPLDWCVARLTRANQPRAVRLPRRADLRAACRYLRLLRAACGLSACFRIPFDPFAFFAD